MALSKAPGDDYTTTPTDPLLGQEPVTSLEQARSSAPGPDLQEAAALLFASVLSETHPGSTYGYLMRSP